MTLFNFFKVGRTLIASVIITSVFLSSADARGSKSRGTKTGIPSRVSIGEKNLVLNGHKMRYKWGFEVYEAGLFLSEKCKCEKKIMTENREPKRVHITMRRDVESEKFTGSIQESINGNFTGTEKKKFASELKSFLGSFSIFPTLKKDTVIAIDYVPQTGTVITVNGKKTEPIPGDEFYHCVLRFWIGNPNQESMKPGLLGR